MKVKDLIEFMETLKSFPSDHEVEICVQDAKGRSRLMSISHAEKGWDEQEISINFYGRECNVINYEQRDKMVRDTSSALSHFIQMVK